MSVPSAPAKVSPGPPSRSSNSPLASSRSRRASSPARSGRTASASFPAWPGTPSAFACRSAHQAPWVHAHIDLHNHVAKPAGIRLGLVRRVRRNQQPVPGLHLERLPPFNGLPAILSRYHSILILQILPVGDFPAHDHLARPAGNYVKVVGPRVHFRVVPHAVHLRQAQHRLLAVRAVQHEYAEIPRRHVNRAAAKRLRAPAARLRQGLLRLFRQLRVRLPNVIDIPIGDRRRVRCQRRLARGVVAEWHHFAFLLRHGAGNHRKLIEVSAEHAFRPNFGPHRLPCHKTSDRRSNYQRRNHLLHTASSESKRNVLFRLRLGRLKPNLFQKLHLLLQLRLSRWKFVEAQQVRQNVRVLLLRQFPQRPLRHRFAYAVEQIPNRQPIPVRQKRSARQWRRPSAPNQRIPMARSAFLAIQLLAALRLLFRVHAIPYRSRGRRRLLRARHSPRSAHFYPNAERSYHRQADYRRLNLFQINLLRAFFSALLSVLCVSAVIFNS